MGYTSLTDSVHPRKLQISGGTYFFYTAARNRNFPKSIHTRYTYHHLVENENFDTVRQVGLQSLNGLFFKRCPLGPGIPPIFHKMLVSIPGMIRFWKVPVTGGCVYRVWKDFGKFRFRGAVYTLHSQFFASLFVTGSQRLSWFVQLLGIFQGLTLCMQYCNDSELIHSDSCLLNIHPFNSDGQSISKWFGRIGCLSFMTKCDEIHFWPAQTTNHSYNANMSKFLYFSNFLRPLIINGQSLRLTASSRGNTQTELQCTYSAGLFRDCLQSGVPGLHCSADSVPQGTALKGLCSA